MTSVTSWVKKIWPTNIGRTVHYSYTHCAQLVERSRNGDQVATSIISRVRKQAEKGNKLAKESLNEIVRYAKANPPYTPAGAEAAELSAFCAEPNQNIDNIGPALSKVALANPNSASVAIANSCNATALAKELNAALEHDGFLLAFKNPGQFLKVMRKLDHESQHAALLGFVLGLACRLQAVRKPNAPIGIYSQVVAWELGE